MWYDSLLQQGYVPEGAEPNVVKQEGDDPLSRFAAAIGKYHEEVKTKTAERQKTLTNKMDMYKTLRDNGYAPQKAYDAVHSDNFELPKDAPADTATDKLRQSQVEANKARTAYYNRLGGGIGDTINPQNTKDLTFKILNKLSAGETLLPGEQKVYDDYIKKYGSKTGLEEALGSDPQSAPTANQAPQAAAPSAAPKAGKLGKSDYIRMSDPAGTPKLVHPEDVDKAIKLGWKKRT